MSELRRIGVRLMAEGVDQYKNDLRTASQEARTMAQETRLAMAELGNNASATSKFQTELKSLERQYDVQARKLKSLESAQKDFSSNLKVTERNIKSTSDAFSKSKTTTDQLEKEYKELGNTMGWNATKTKEAKKAWQESKAETDALGNELSELEKTQANYNKELEKMPGKINSAKISMAEMSNQAQKLTEDYVNAGGRFADTADKMEKTGGKIKSVSSAIGSVGSKLTTSVTIPLVAMGAAAATVGIQFEKQMSRVGAVAGATGSELEAMTEQAKELGASTAFSASEAAQGMENLASAGFDASQIMATMPGVLDLAAVSGGDVALASEAAATAINAFGLEASDSAHIADVFARAAADTNAEVGDMAEAMKYAAPMANTLGLSIEDTAAAIGIMSDAGIKGSQAGTTLRGAFTRLAKPTKQASDAMAELGFNAFDANGKVKPMSQIMTELAGSMQGMTKEQQAQTMATIFGQEAMSGMMALVEAGGGKVDTLSRSLENSAGAADKMASAMQDNVAGTIEEMMGALETAGIEITEALAPAITAVAENVTELVNSFNELDDGTKQTILKFLAFAAATGPVLSGIGKVGNGIGTLYTGGSKLVRMFGKWEAGAKLLGPATSSAGTALTTLAGGASTAAGASGVGGLATALVTTLPWALGIAAVAMGGYAAWKIWGEDAYKASQDTKDFGGVVGEVGREIITEFDEVNHQVSSAHSEMATNAEEGAQKAKEAYNGLVESVSEDLSKVGKESEETFNKLPENVREVLKTVNDDYQTGLSTQQEIISSYQDNVNKIYDRASEERRELTDAEKRFIADTAEEMYRIEIENADMTSEEKINALKAYNLEYEDMSRERLSNLISEGDNRRRETRKQYDNDLQALREWGEEAGATTEEMLAAENQLKSKYKAEQLHEAAMMVEQQRALGIDEAQILENLRDSYGEYGISIADVNKEIASSQEKTASLFAVSTDEMSEAMRKANDSWNNMLFEHKIAELDTNAAETFEEIASTQEGWEQLEYYAKNADIDSNAKEFIGQAMATNMAWFDLEWEEKQALISSNVGEQAEAFLVNNGLWDSLDYKEQEAILNTNTSEELEQVLKDIDLWEQLDPTEKDAILTTTSGIAAQTYLDFLGIWDSIDPENKEAILHSNSGEAMEQALIDAGVWDQLDWETKLAIVMTNSGQKIKEALQDKEIWDGLEYETKMMLAQSNMDEETLALMTYHDLWNSTEFLDKLANIDTNAPDATQQVMDLIEQWTGSELEEKNGQVTVTEFGVKETQQNLSDYNREVGLMTETKFGKVQVESNVDQHTPSIQEWNEEMQILPPNKTSVMFVQQNASANSPAVERWNQAQNNAKSTSTSATTSTNAPTPTAQVNAWNTAQGGTHSTSTSARTSTNAPTPTSQVNAWNTAQGNTHSTNTRATTSTNASSNTGAVNDWTRSVNNAPAKKKSVFTTIYETVQKFIKGKATGDLSWEGGQVWLGDGGRREPYLTPTGQFGVSGNDWELHNLPKGTRIWPSRQAFRTSANNNPSLAQYLDALPKFAKGGRIDSAYDGYTGLVGEAGPEIFQIAQGKVSITPISSNDRTKVLEAQTNNGSNIDMSDTNQLLETLISLVAQGQVINMDGRAVGNTIFPYIDETMNNKLNRSSVMGMGGN